MPISKVRPPTLTKPPRISARVASETGFSSAARTWPGRAPAPRASRVMAKRVRMARSSVGNRSNGGDLVEGRQVAHERPRRLFREVGIGDRRTAHGPFGRAVELAHVL